MTITRIIENKEVSIELTDDEMWKAHEIKELAKGEASDAWFAKNVFGKGKIECTIHKH